MIDIKDIKKMSQQDLKNTKTKRTFPTNVKESLELDPTNIKPILIPVDSTHKLWKDWNSISEHVASFLFRRSPGRNCYFLVQNEYDGRNLGIIDVAADFLSLGPRDQYIGWSLEQRIRLNRNIANISICVPTRLFGYNMAGGKLLALLATSDFVGNYWKERYGDDLAGLTVTSLYGRGTQYNRLKHFNYLGKTQGQGTTQVPDGVYKQLRLVVEKHEGKIPGGRFTKGKNSRINIIRRACKHLNIDASELTTHGQQRGIYWANRGNTKDFLTEQVDTFIPNDELTIENLTEHWVDRWANKRMQNLTDRNDIQTKKTFF